MEEISRIFGGGADLAAMASMAGVGGAAASVLAALVFRGFFMKLISSLITTAVMTGAGFLFLLNALGYRVVADEAAQAELREKASAMLQDTLGDVRDEARASGANSALAGALTGQVFGAESLGSSLAHKASTERCLAVIDQAAEAAAAEAAEAMTAKSRGRRTVLVKPRSSEE